MSPQSLEVPKIKIKIKIRKTNFLIFIFIFETSSDCEESNVYHLKKYPFHPAVVHRPCGSCCSYVFMYMFCKINDESS